jgi:hypothetical protein
LLPQRAYVPQQPLVAGMQDVQVGKAKLAEFGDQIAIEVWAFRAFVDPVHGQAGGQADGRPVRADLPGNRADDLDGEAGAVRDGAAIFIAARVGARGEELLDEIGVRAVNLDTIGASIDSGARRTAEVGDGPARSSLVSARGAGMSFIPVAVNICAPGAIAEGATAWR